MDKKDENPETYPWLGRQFLWADNPKAVDRLVYGLYGLCALLVLADFFYYKKTYFGIEKFIGFYAWYGFIMCAALVVCAKAMRLFLMRDESYYSPKDVESEEYPEDQLERVNYDD